MNEPATLEPILYEPILNDAGQRVGWKVPDHERERWESGSGYRSGTPETGTARPVKHLVAALEACLYLDDRLEARVRALYELDAPKITRLVDHTIEQARAGRLDNPAGFLASRLRAIEGAAL